MALEQFSLVLVRRGGTGPDQRYRRLSDDNSSTSGLIKSFYAGDLTEVGCPMSRFFCETWESADLGHPPLGNSAAQDLPPSNSMPHLLTLV